MTKKRTTLSFHNITIVFFLGVGIAMILSFGNLNAFNPDNSIVGSIEIDKKQKGAHVFGIVDSTDFQPLRDGNLEWITLVPWGFQKDFDSAEVSHGKGNSAWLAKNNMQWCEKIELVRNAGFKVFFKPHLWVHEPTDGKWRSDIFPTNDKNWETWRESYTNFILRYASVAEDAGAEMFCLGTEFTRLTLEKPEYWRYLISEVRKVYSGRLTYAANWYKEYEKVTFWDELDYIGIQAYFPLSKKENPSVKEVTNGWNKYMKSMESVHKKYDRTILFTEMGYKSTADGAIKPWEWAEDPSRKDVVFSSETQVNCYEAFFNSIWPKEWFAGVHIWQLRSDFAVRNRGSKLDFTPQGKPAVKTIAKGFE